MAMCGRMGKNWQHGECETGSGDAECVNRGTSLCVCGGGGKPTQRGLRERPCVVGGGDDRSTKSGSGGAMCVEPRH
jgi:hypothetical protein